MKNFIIGNEYEVYNEQENMSWSNTLTCIKRTNNYVWFEEHDEHNGFVATYKRLLRHTRSTEYVYLVDATIVWAN